MHEINNKQKKNSLQIQRIWPRRTESATKQIQSIQSTELKDILQRQNIQYLRKISGEQEIYSKK